MKLRATILLSLAATVLLAGCFASKADFEKLQADMLTARVTSNVADFPCTEIVSTCGNDGSGS